MASENADPHPGRGRLHTVYWLLLTVLFGLPLITPLWRWSAVACTHDGHLHYHRVAAMAHAWENGVFLTRWLPDLAFGYGYPFFVFREAGPLYAVLLPHLAGLPLPAASNLFYALTILLSGVFMFLWVRDIFGPRAGLVSAVAYMAAPYVLVDALVRGNAPESLALPLLPFILWLGRRWVLFGSIRAFVAGVLGLALLSVSHNISTFIFAPVLLVYLGALAIWGGRWQQATEDGRQRTDDRPLSTDHRPRTTDHGPQTTESPSSAVRRPLSANRRLSSVVRRPSAVGGRLIRLLTLLALGLGLAFFYTGGALLEMDEVTLEMSTTTRNNDWRFNFASPGEILAPVAAEDPALVNPPLLFRLGWAPLLLAVAGLSGLVWIKGRDPQAREQRLHIWLMVIGAAVFLFMALPISRWLWEALPLIDFVQFPWRFVGRAALPVAFLAGVPFYWFDQRGETTDDGRQTTDGRRQTTDGRRQTTDDGRRRFSGLWSVVRGPQSVVRGPQSALITVLAIGLLIIESIPNLYPRVCAEEPFPTIGAVHTYEHLTGLVGVDPEGSYFPRTVQERPAGSPLEADYAAGRVPQRFDLSALPTSAAASDVVYDRFGVTLTVDSPEPFTARYLSFAFPGWSARIDGQPVEIVAEDPTGLITFEVPAGTHEVTVAWGATPLRLALVGLSVLSAVGVTAVMVWGRRRPRTADHGPRGAFHGRSGRNELALLLLLGVGLLGFKVFADRSETVLRRTAAPTVEHASTLQGSELALNGFNLSRDRVPAGETFDIDMAWTAVAPPAVDYQSEISIVGPDGLAWSQKGTERPRVYEDAANTRQWSAGEWGWDSREVRILSGAPPGVYDVVLTLFDRDTLAPTTLVDVNSGQAVGPSAVIGQIEVVNPDEPPLFEAQYPVEHDFPALGLRLLGYNQDRAEAAPGDSVLLTWFWECVDPALCDSVSLRLEDESGSAVGEWGASPVRADFPPESWPAHGRLRGQHVVRLPADLPAGDYRFVIEDFPLSAIAVTAPERQFTSPALAQQLDATFTSDGTAITTLVGIAADSPLPPCAPSPLLSCALPLVWRAETAIPDGYHVFVHLVDEADNILAQSDAVPANWTRPTTGWLPGEYVIDSHSLQLPGELPPGPLSLRVGLYDPVTGERPRLGGEEFVTIPLAAIP